MSTAPDPHVNGQPAEAREELNRLGAECARLNEQLASRQRIWEQLEVFIGQIHGSLDPTEVAYIIANEGRRLVECDRVSVAVRYGSVLRVEAVTGADAVAKRANLIQKLRTLCERVIAWGEPLVFQGVPDDSLPPEVHQALDAYVAESNSKLLVVLPLREPSTKEVKPPPQAALVAESFEPTVEQITLVNRLRVLERHVTSALHNAREYRTIPFRFIWQPIARLQKGLGGKTRAIIAGVTLAVVLCAGALFWVPYPLKMDANGRLVPRSVRGVYSSHEAHVAALAPGVQPGGDVVKGQSLLLMYDTQLHVKMVQLQNDVATARRAIESLTGLHNATLNPSERGNVQGDKRKKEAERDAKMRELQILCERTHADGGRPGYFWIKAPASGTILNWGFQENLLNRQVKPSEMLLLIGDKNSGFEVELKVPHKHMGRVLLAFDPDDPRDRLDVDLLLLTVPTRTFKGMLPRNKIGGEATPNKDNATDTEPVLYASVELDDPGIPEDAKVPADFLVPGTEVHAKVRCGDVRLGYALFYGVWEFFHEKVVYWF